MKSPGMIAILTRHWPKLIVALAAFAAFLITSMPARQAFSAIAGDPIKFQITTDSTGPYRLASTGGGEFRVVLQPGSSSPGESFYTFCLERNEFLDFSTTFTISSINTIDAVLGGVGGGVGGPPTADPISKGTELLYRLYSQGASPGADLTNFGGSGYTRSGTTAVNNDWAGALQNVIWRLEDEVFNTLTPGYSGLNATQTGYADALWNAVIAQFGTEANARSNATLPSEVTVMNITYPNGTRAQSQLYWMAPIEPVVPTVPEPISLGVWAALFGMGSIYSMRKRR